MILARPILLENQLSAVILRALFVHSTQKHVNEPGQRLRSSAPVSYTSSSTARVAGGGEVSPRFRLFYPESGHHALDLVVVGRLLS